MPKQWHTPLETMQNQTEVWAAIDRHSWKGPEVDLEPEISYFNNTRTHGVAQEYDLYFSYAKVYPLWNPKKHRENRGDMAQIRNNIYEQERVKSVPALTSQVYGKLVPYDRLETGYQRKSEIKDFYRKFGAFCQKDNKEI